MSMLIGIGMALAGGRDIELKVHDMRGVVSGELSVELGEPGQAPLRYTCRDDGVEPDAVAGDRLYTARVAGLALDHGAVTVRAGEQVWQGGFRFDAGSDPVLLVGLEAGGFAAASTREVVFAPPGGGGPGPGAEVGGGRGESPPQRPPGADAAGGAAATSGPPGAAPSAPMGAAPGDAPGAPGSVEATGGRRVLPRAPLPSGLWTGWLLGAVALGALGGVAWASGRRAPRIPVVVGGPPTTVARGPWVPCPDAADLVLGPLPPGCGAAAMGPGRWTPAEVALAALAMRRPARVVLTDPARLEVEGDAEAALTAALAGVADLLLVQAPAGTAEGPAAPKKGQAVDR